MPQSDFRVLGVDRLDSSEVDRFLRRVFGEAISGFLRSYASWWHQGNQNRMVVVRNDEIVAYCGWMPTKCLINGVEYPAKWGINMIVAPEFRGRGLETLLDKELREADLLTLGFPSKMASNIYRKHGWGIRDDCHFLMLPLLPTKMDYGSISAATGMPTIPLWISGHVVTPLTTIVRQRLARYEPTAARELESPDPELLTGVYARSKDKLGAITTCRDVEFIRWRYEACPYRSELSFYVSGPPDSPSQYAILRCMRNERITSARILDVFGDFNDTEGLRDILRLAVRDAVRGEACQITAFTSEPRIRSVLSSFGFLGVRQGFCWFSKSSEIMQSLSFGKYYWTMGDSDKDAPA
jgi:GNAT superfamily N-acetyltransferase